jgi:hypothetical protein
MFDQARMAQFPPSEALTAQRRRHAFRRQVHGVTFGHNYPTQHDAVEQAKQHSDTEQPE